MKIKILKVEFKYDTLKDAWSWVEIAKRKKALHGKPYKQQVPFIPVAILKKIQKNSKKDAIKITFEYLDSSPDKKKREKIINYTKKIIKEVWSKIENQYFIRLSKITKEPIYTKKFTCYLTSGIMCPYNDKENWFMVSIKSPFPNSITTIAHEILHFQFIHHYKTYCRKYLTKKQFDILKESLTVLLNIEFKDLLLTIDKGYPSHQKLRIHLEKLWKKDKDFLKFLNGAISLIKNIKKLNIQIEE